MLKGTYFDAQLRQQIEGNVYPQKEGLLIQLPGRELFWNHKNITRSRAELPGRIILKHGDAYQPDTVDLDESWFVHTLKQGKIKVGYLPRAVSRQVGGVAAGLLLFAFLVLGAMALGFWLSLPGLSRLVAKKIPRPVEQQLAEPMLSAFLSGQAVDFTRTTHLNHFLEAMDLEVDIPVKATVVESPVLNAFAIPGGQLVVYSALIDSLQHPGQLVALLGHEAGHIQHRHSLQSLISELSRHLILALVLQDQEAIMAVLIERANMMQTLAYGRELELEADVFGLHTLQQNGFAPAEMASLLQLLGRQHSESAVPGFLSTHPSSDERLKRVSEWEHKPIPAPEKQRHKLLEQWELLRRR